LEELRSAYLTISDKARALQDDRFDDCQYNHEYDHDVSSLKNAERGVESVFDAIKSHRQTETLPKEIENYADRN